MQTALRQVHRASARTREAMDGAVYGRYDFCLPLIVASDLAPCAADLDACGAPRRAGVYLASPHVMRVLLTGADGYIGSVLGSVLEARGHHVTRLDTGFYREGWLSLAPEVAVEHDQDVRQISTTQLHGIDAVVHLGELSNDPLGALDTQLTYAINHQGTLAFADLCRQAGVRRFVYSSSCSVYGAGGDDIKTETSAPNPQTAYAECKALVEQGLARLACPAFSPTYLRNATAFGVSPRMRFDLVLNNLAGLACTAREIALTSDGAPWRPLVHVRDISEAFACVLDAPIGLVHDQAFNVGRDDNNHRVRDIAAIVNRTFPDCTMTTGPSSGDRRSYRVSFDKIRRQLPGFWPRWTVEDGAHELREHFERVGLTKERFAFRPFTRVKQLQHLRNSGQLDDRLFWTVPPSQRRHHHARETHASC